MSKQMQHDTQATPRERLIYRLAFAVFVFFTVYGIYLLFYPTDFLTDLFGVLLLLTLGIGVVSGIIAVASS